MLAWLDEMHAAQRPAVIFAYALGKAERLLAELHAARFDRAVYVHGSLVPPIDAYRASGVALPAVARAADTPRGTDFAGALVVAPVSARGSTWMRRFGDHGAAFASGWMRVRGNRRRRGYDRGFVLSDHADWAELLTTIADTGATKVLATHGYKDVLARACRETGLAAEVLATEFTGETDEGEGT